MEKVGSSQQHMRIAEMHSYVQTRSDVRLVKPLLHFLSSNSTQLRYEL
jgi:hypothetical protein